jgi:ElaB/YqjD/DUF883 family membrane-anchored ribosome-binding protein
MKPRYETPDAIRHDAHTLADDARTLLEATSELTDAKITEAREKLTEALEASKQSLGRLQEKAKAGAQAADKVIRDHPYQSIAIAFGVGALIGILVSRRNN